MGKKTKNLLQCFFCLKRLRDLACMPFPFGMPAEYYGDQEDCPHYKDKESEKEIRGHLRLVKK